MILDETRKQNERRSKQQHWLSYCTFVSLAATYEPIWLITLYLPILYSLAQFNPKSLLHPRGACPLALSHRCYLSCHSRADSAVIQLLFIDCLSCHSAATLIFTSGSPFMKTMMSALCVSSLSLSSSCCRFGSMGCRSPDKWIPFIWLIDYTICLTIWLIFRKLIRRTFS